MLSIKNILMTCLLSLILISTLSANQIGDIAPNFTAKTTKGTIDFHNWSKEKWIVLFSNDLVDAIHPEALTRNPTFP